MSCIPGRSGSFIVQLRDYLEWDPVWKSQRFLAERNFLEEEEPPTKPPRTPLETEGEPQTNYVRARRYLNYNHGKLKIAKSTITLDQHELIKKATLNIKRRLEAEGHKCPGLDYIYWNGPDSQGYGDLLHAEYQKLCENLTDEQEDEILVASTQGGAGQSNLDKGPIQVDLGLKKK